METQKQLKEKKIIDETLLRYDIRTQEIVHEIKNQKPMSEKEANRFVNRMVKQYYS